MGKAIQTEVIKAIKERYGDLPTLKMAMWECEDTVLMNLNDDLEVELDERDLLVIIHNLLR